MNARYPDEKLQALMRDAMRAHAQAEPALRLVESMSAQFTIPAVRLQEIRTALSQLEGLAGLGKSLSLQIKLSPGQVATLAETVRKLADRPEFQHRWQLFAAPDLRLDSLVPRGVHEPATDEGLDEAVAELDQSLAEAAAADPDDWLRGLVILDDQRRLAAFLATLVLLHYLTQATSTTAGIEGRTLEIVGAWVEMLLALASFLWFFAFPAGKGD